MGLRSHSDTIGCMTTNGFENKDTETAYKLFVHDFNPLAVRNTISALQAIGYTIITPFIKPLHVKACAEITSAFEAIGDSKGEPVDNNKIVAMCVLALTHMKYLDDIVTIIKERRVTSSHEVSHLLRVMKKVSEPLN